MYYKTQKNATFLDPSINKVTLYGIVTRRVISTRVESGLLARFARSSTTINFKVISCLFLSYPEMIQFYESEQIEL